MVRYVNLNSEELTTNVEIRAKRTIICIDILVHWEGAGDKIEKNEMS